MEEFEFSKNNQGIFKIIGVLSGVPQESVLGPLLFLISINDMPELVRHFLKLFADDTKIISIKKNSTVQKTLQEDLDNLVDLSRTGWSSTKQI